MEKRKKRTTLNTNKYLQGVSFREFIARYLLVSKMRSRFQMHQISTYINTHIGITHFPLSIMTSANLNIDIDLILFGVSYLSFYFKKTKPIHKNNSNINKLSHIDRKI